MKKKLEAFRNSLPTIKSRNKILIFTMENHLIDPLFENFWTSSPRIRSFPREVPVTPSPRRYTGKSPVNYGSGNRTIPVHFIGLENKRLNAALKIQKVFRGFLVRKNMKKIAVIKTEVDEMERKLFEKDMIDLIYSNTKERLKMNEMLMRLLLKLDSIRGVDSGVRDARKSVTRKAIMLQDRVDKIAAGDLIMQEAGDKVLEDTNDASEDMEICKSVVDRFVEQNSMTESPEKSNMDGRFRLKMDEEKLVESIEEGWEEIPVKEEIKETVIEVQQPEMVKEGDTKDEMMARMLEGNQKLTELVTQLCRSNALQTQMISSLSQRVESLEKAYKKDKLRRRKKKINKSGLAD